MKIKCLLVLLLLLWGVDAENANMTELFVIPIHPQQFNWTFIGTADDFSFRPSLLNAPDLPQWIHYVYSKSDQVGYLYGVPPVNQANLEIEIIGLNRKTYETRRTVLPVNIHKKAEPARYEIELKIDNLNVEDMIEETHQKQLLAVIKQNLWLESRSDLYVTLLVSAVDYGARLPLKPDEKEGVVVRVGSRAEFSTAVVELQEEVKPLWKLAPCPRGFKRTSVDRLFREQGFVLDWCFFKLITVKDELHQSQHHFPALEGHHLPFGLDDRWSRPSKAQVPQRSYVHEFAFTILVPMLVMILLVILLSLILCFHHEGMDEASSEYFETLFDLFDQVRSKRNKETPAVQMVQYAAVQRATHTLRSLSSQRDASNTPSELCSTSLSRSRTGSPNSSLPRTGTPRAPSECNTVYCRPNPPPYSGPNRKQAVAEWLA